jgi:hypothetical protein
MTPELARKIGTEGAPVPNEGPAEKAAKAARAAEHAGQNAVALGTIATFSGMARKGRTRAGTRVVYVKFCNFIMIFPRFLCSPTLTCPLKTGPDAMLDFGPMGRSNE